ncbi:MAG: right-handed parallel beta-helix repeat-containing protein [Candidatus Heimdallarchaeota archaeon]|nr:right-handed parallel beta-helix repeat-containing protein [Candidatus Heimdallarchaeota archaeon]MCK4771035.1 right-handed parallel beta-helix repeat-containing protein [Candidatus Heimdallarchaeota archaeon]
MSKNKKVIVVVSLIILVLISIRIFQRDTLQNDEEILDDEIDYTNIKINSNSDFKIYDIPGNGTVIDPYIINDEKLKYDIKHIKISNTSVHIVIKNCTFSNNYEAIRIIEVKSGSIEITGNIFNGNSMGISLHTHVRVLITNNHFINNSNAGVGSFHASNMQLIENWFYNSGLHIMTLPFFIDTTIVRDNYVNDKKLGFFVNMSNLSFIETQEFGQLIFIGCENININYLNIQNTVAGIYCLYSTDISIRYNFISFCDTGIRIWVCENISITDNRLIDNSCGLICNQADGIILNNEINNSVYGLAVSHSSFLVIANNKLRNHYLSGMWFSYSSNNLIRDNIVELSYICGVKVISDSNGNIFHHNIFYKNGIQAEDHCSNNTWYDKIALFGNYWSDYDETGIYYIPGEAGAVDLYPQLIYD